MVKLSNGNKYINRSMKITVSVTKILHFIYTMIPENFVDVEEKHDFWEIVYLESGEAIVNADGREHILLAGEAYFHKPVSMTEVHLNPIRHICKDPDAG